MNWRQSFFLLWLSVFSITASAQTSVLLESPVRITVEAKADNRPEPRAPVTTLNLAINQGTHEFRVSVIQPGTTTEAIAMQKALTGWKDGYLFIRDDCFGGNEAKRAWRCIVDQVFTFVEGRNGKRLVHLGEVFAGEDCIEEAKIGCALYKGTFTDVYDGQGNNALTNRAESPALLLEMRVVSGEFVVDLDDTWGSNQERFSAGERCLMAKPAERTLACVEGITPSRAYVFNSTLATYTKHTEQLTRIQPFARAALCDGKAEADCSELLRRSALMLAAIRPGERPKPRGNVVSVPLPAAK